MADDLCTPRFLDGARGHIFSVCHVPDGQIKSSFIYLPPFGEELNRCRHLVAEQARQLSAAGVATLILDPYGTGDSEGASEDASWQTWHEDVLIAARWMEAEFRLPVHLWGLRLGGLLALDVAASNAERFARLLLWQPVTSGQTYITQLLRQRVAALASGAEQETTKQLRERLSGGEALDVGGYTLGPQLTADVDTLKATELAGLTGVRIDWLEHSPTGEPSPGATKAAQQLIEQGNQVTLQTFASPPLWQLVSRADMSDLYAKTLELVST